MEAPWRNVRWRWVLAGLALLVWFGGGVGWLARNVALRMLPREGRAFRLASVGTAVVPEPATGIVVHVSAPRVRRLLREALGWKAHAIPPGTIPEWFTVDGTLRVRLSEKAEPVWLPCVLRIVPDLAAPRATVRLPAAMVNEALSHEGSFAHQRKTRRYALGRYTIIHALRFDTLTLRSAIGERHRGRAVTFRRIEGYATGEVRLRVEENWMDFRTTARVRRMHLRGDFDFRRYIDGIALAYTITIPTLDADIRNLAPVLERPFVEPIRKALEDSIARPRNLDRLARRRLPQWLPLDLELDIEAF